MARFNSFFFIVSLSSSQSSLFSHRSLFFSDETLTLVHPNPPRIRSNMLQSIHYIILNTNPPLKLTCALWIDVDLESFFHGFQTVFVLLFKSFLNEIFYEFVDLQRLIFVVDRRIFTFFKKKLGFPRFLMKLFELPWIYIDLNLLMFLSKKKVGLCVYLCFNWRFEPESSRTLEFWFCLLIFWLESENKSVISSSSSSPVQILWIFFPSSSQSSSAIALEFAASSGEFALEL